MRAAALCLIVVFALAGCGEDGSTKSERAGGGSGTQASGGRLSSAPDPLTIEDVRKVPQGTAQATVLRILFWAQWGNLPALVDAYDRRVVQRVGASEFTGAFAWLRPRLSSTRFRLLSARRSGDNVFVGLELATTDAAPTREGFVTRRVDGRWRVVYDTLLDQGLKGYVASITATSPRAPNAKALRAGEKAAQAYRDVYPSVARLRE